MIDKRRTQQKSSTLIQQNRYLFSLNLQMMTKFESLTNELFYCLYEYLDDVHLVRAFHGLNYRFNCLLSSRFRLCHLNLRSVYKEDFDLICREYFLVNSSRLISLHLSDDDDTPTQLDHFLTFHPAFDYLIQLRSLSFLNIRYTYSIHNIIRQLPNLTQLTISACFSSSYSNNIPVLIDSIWSLPKLTTCKLENVVSPHETFESVPSIVSMSMVQLIINNHNHLIIFHRLFEYTPNLRHLSIPLWQLYSIESWSFPLQRLKNLNLSFQGSSTALIGALQMLPNLSRLILKSEQINLNGHQWQQIIEDHLPQLQILKFLAQITLSNAELSINELLQSFQTPFWRDKHQWNVQCHRTLVGSNEIISLYTLPYFFDDFVYPANLVFPSTTTAYDRVHTLFCNSCSSVENFPSSSPIRFRNIRNLHVEFPLNRDFWSIVPTVHQLKSLNIGRYNNEQACYQLQSLLDQTPELDLLAFTSTSFSPKFLFQLNSRLVRQLDFYDCNHWFNKKQCLALKKSLLSEHCEVLWIKVKKRSCILPFVNGDSLLRALIFQCEDDPWLTEENNLPEWLEKHLPTTSLFSREINKVDIRIWIR